MAFQPGTEKGIEFATTAAAIEHSKDVARRLRNEPRLKDPELSIVVIDKSGSEIHREPVYPDPAKPGIPFDKTGTFKTID